jgi:hypothetical protein
MVQELVMNSLVYLALNLTMAQADSSQQQFGSSSTDATLQLISTTQIGLIRA